MTASTSGVLRARGRSSELLILDFVAAPRWLRERRRLALRAREAVVDARAEAERRLAEQEAAERLRAQRNLELMLHEFERTNGPITQEELDEVDRLWRANLGR